jgi:EmrB/QacA subfamily drug resistance transporter
MAATPYANWPYDVVVATARSDDRRRRQERFHLATTSVARTNPTGRTRSRRSPMSTQTIETTPHDGGETRAPDPLPRRWLGLALLSAAQFMLILDITVVNIALPSIGTELALDRATLTWVVSAYTLVFGGLLLLGGRAADQFGARRVGMAGLALFTAASLVAGLAGGGAVLIGARLAQGAGAALLSPAALSIISTTFHGAERNKALGVFSSLGGVGAAVGVLLGGAFTAGPGWQWAFYINVPVGVAILAALPLVTPARLAPRGRTGMNLTGAVLATAAAGLVIYGLINAGDQGWTGRWTALPIAAGLVLYVGFVASQRVVRSPLLDVRILANRSMLAGGLLILAVTGLMIACFFLGSFYLQQLRGFSALVTGLLFLPVAVGTIIGAQNTGRLLGRLGSRTTTVVSLAQVVVGMGIAGLWTYPAVVVAGITLAAIGLGPLFVIGAVVALSDAPPERAGVASGLVSTFHELGGALGVAAISSVAAAGLATHGAIASVDGFSRGFWFSAAFALVAAVVAGFAMPNFRPPAAQSG